MVTNDSWREIRLGDVATIARGGSPRPIQAFLTTNPDGINWIKIGDVKAGEKYITSTQERIVEEGRSKSRDVHAGDLILSNSMSYGRPYILRIDGCIHDGWLVIQHYESAFDQDFLFYALSSWDTFNQYRAMSAGSGVQNLSKDKVANVVIYAPSLDEQRVIASKLNILDELIEALERIIIKKRAIAKGIRHYLLTGQIRLSGFQDAWVTKSLMDCFVTKRGNTLSRDELNYRKGSTKDIHYGDVLTIFPTLVDVGSSRVPFITDDSIDVGEKLQNGDLVITDTAEDSMVGKACEITGADAIDVVAGLHTIALHPVDDRFAFGFAGYFINSTAFHDSLLPYTHGTKVISLSKSDLMKLEIEYPSLDEQQGIVDALTRADEEIVDLECKIEKYKQIRQGMMRELLTGHIRLVQE